MNLSHYLFEYDYDIYRQCEHGSYCCDRDYCRCGVITDERVTEVPSESLIIEFKNFIDKKKKWNDFENYCLGRLFISHELYETEKYELTTCRGYYGEEINGVCCDCWDKFEKDAIEMLSLSDDDKIKYVLKKEYGYLLDGLENAAFEIKFVEYSDILPPDDYRKVKGKSVDFNAPIGIYKPIGEKYRIIDGHHRWKNSEDRKYVYIIVAITN